MFKVTDTVYSRADVRLDKVKGEGEREPTLIMSPLADMERMGWSL